MQFFPTSHHNRQKRTDSQKRGMMSMKPNKSPVIYCARAIANEPRAAAELRGLRPAHLENHRRAAPNLISPR